MESVVYSYSLSALNSERSCFATSCFSFVNSSIMVQKKKDTYVNIKEEKKPELFNYYRNISTNEQGNLV